VPFKRCSKCGKDFLAKDDAQDLCKPNCPGALVEAFDAKPAEDRWWTFPAFFLGCCVVTYLCYDNAYDVELFLIRNVPFMRESMATKLAQGCPASLDQVVTAVADPDIAVAKSVLLAVAENVVALPNDDPLLPEFVAQLRQIYENPDEDLGLKQAAIAAMGTIRDPDIESVLYRALSDRRLVRGAVFAMKTVGTDRAVKPLMDIVEDKMGHYRNDDTRYQAVIALGRIPDEKAEALPVLIDAYRDESGLVRDEALTAMYEICKRYKSLTMNGQDNAKAALKAMHQYGKSDRIYTLRERSKTLAAELDKIVGR